MKISLKHWRVLDNIVKELKHAIEVADSQSFALFDEYHKPGEALNTPEVRAIMKLNGQIHELRQQASMLMDCHPQSEWMGGDSDNPKNHKLREPNSCPAPRRYFTDAEIEEAKMVCHGPCDWTGPSNEELSA